MKRVIIKSDLNYILTQGRKGAEKGIKIVALTVFHISKKLRMEDIKKEHPNQTSIGKNYSVDGVK